MPPLVLLVALLTGHCGLTAADATCGCPDSYHTFGGKCYKLITGNERNFKGAKEWCFKKEGEAIVAEPRTNEEFHEILHLVQGHHRDRQLWVGITDEIREGKHAYDSDQSPFLLGDHWFAPGHPNDHDQRDCVSFPQKKFLLESEQCGNGGQFVCEKPATSGSGTWGPWSEWTCNYAENTCERHRKCNDKCCTGPSTDTRDVIPEDDPPLKCLDDGFQLFGTKCYKLITGNERNFEGAKSWCSDEADGAIVAEPRTNEEFHELLRLVQGHHRDRQLWVGITDKVTEGKHVYDSDQSPFLLGKDWFAPGHPNDHDQRDCVSFPQTKFLLESEQCGHGGQFVCEKPATGEEDDETSESTGPTVEKLGGENIFDLFSRLILHVFGRS